MTPLTRTLTDLWRRVHQLDAADAKREDLQTAYLRLLDWAEEVPKEHRMVVSGALQKAVLR